MSSETSQITANDRDAILAIVNRLNNWQDNYSTTDEAWRKHRDMIYELRDIASRLAVSPAKAEAKPEAACPYEHSTVLCNKCGWSPNRPAPTPSPAKDDSIESVADAIASGKYLNAGQIIDRLRALAAKQADEFMRGVAEGTREADRTRPAHAQAAEVAASLERWARDNLLHSSATHNVRRDELHAIAEKVRRLQPTREMPGSVRALCEHTKSRANYSQEPFELVAAVEAHYTTPAIAPDAVPVVKDETPVVRVTHGVEHINTGDIVTFNTPAKCVQWIGGRDEHYRLVRLAFGGGA